MGHVEAQGLYHVAGALLEGARHVGKGVGGKELSGVLQGFHVGDAVPQLLLRHVGARSVFFQHRRHDLIGTVVLKHGDDVVGHLIHHMDAAGAGIQHDVVAVELILMYHKWFLRCICRPRIKSAALEGGGFLMGDYLLVSVLALLVGNAAAGLAGRLAGGLALAAAAVLGALAQVAGLKSLDSFHDSYLHSH